MTKVSVLYNVCCVNYEYNLIFINIQHIVFFFRFWYFTVRLICFTMEEIIDIDNSDDQKVKNIKLESCCEICINNVSLQPEASDYTDNTEEHLRLQDGADDQINIKTDNITQSANQPQNTFDEMQIKHDTDCDSDIEVDLAYRIIDTFNMCEIKTFKTEDEKILPDNEMPLNMEQTNNKPSQLNVEVDKKTNFLYEMTNICNMKKIAHIKDNVDYENLNVDDDENKKHVHQLQNKGM